MERLEAKLRDIKIDTHACAVWSFGFGAINFLVLTIILFRGI